MSFLVTEWGAAKSEPPMALSHGQESLSKGVIAPRLQAAAHMQAQAQSIRRVGAPQVGTPVTSMKGSASLPASASSVKQSPQASRIQAATAARIQQHMATRPAQQPIAIMGKQPPSGPEISTSSASPRTLQQFDPTAAVLRLRRREPARPRLLIRTMAGEPAPEVRDDRQDVRRLDLEEQNDWITDEPGVVHGGGDWTIESGDTISPPAGGWPAWAGWVAAGLGAVVVGGLVYFTTKGA